MAIKNKSEITTTGELREALADAIVRVSKGEMSAADGKALVSRANQLTKRMKEELEKQ
jgi:polyhydroxyalkanoate synthesis regulator phasin